MFNNKKDKKNDNKPTVFVGLSGGVDSSVAAATLLEQGCNVVGAFIKTWHPSFLQCDWKAERRDAMRVCAHLHIPFRFFDFEEIYKREVVDYLVAEYAAGRTPNPDVMCNRYIKFGAFFNAAQKAGAQFVATGHYAIKKEIGGRAALFEAVDKEKDQSYFLWTLPQNVLARTLFPIGKFKKDKVRRLAKKFGLATAKKPDSQGICFLGDVEMKEFLSHFIKTEPGNVLDTTGKVIGRHDGALLFTLGQRHGFSLNNTVPRKTPMYVIAKDVSTNTITVGPATELALHSISHVKLFNTSWIEQAPKDDEQLLARFRYHQKPQAVTYRETKDGGEIIFAEPQNSIAPGQSLVLYRANEECLGGGVVKV